MTAPADTSTTAPPAPVKSASLWEDFVDIFLSPSEVFERRRNSGFFIPLLVFAILLIAILFVGRSALQPIMDSEFARTAAATMKKNPQVTAEQMETGRRIGEKFQLVFIAIGAFLAPLIVGVVLWIVGKFFQATEDIGAACMVATYAFFPKILDSILQVAQAFFLDPSTMNGRYRLTLGAGRFLDPDVASPVLVSILGRVDVFTIWVTVLLGIGLSIVGRIPRSRAFTAAAIVWVVGMIPGLIGAIRAS